MDAAEDSSIVSLPERLDSAAAHDLYAQIDRYRETNLSLDGSNVTKLGGLCLQVLLSAQQDWQRRKLEFNVKTPSQSLADFLTTIGRQDLLEAEAVCL